MDPDDETVADVADEAAFGAGFDEKPVDRPSDKPPANTEKAPATQAREPETKEPEVAAPEYVQLTKDEATALRAAAAQVASLQQQQARNFGQIGNLQKLINEMRESKKEGEKPSVSKEDFAELRENFPELADMTQAAITKVLSKLPATGNGERDQEAVKTALTEHANKLQLEDLEDEYPDWKAIVGAAPSKDEADPNNPFRQWLATKDATYQARVNETVSASVLSRAIRRFRTETRVVAKPAPKPATNQRADRIRDSVQPKGDGGMPTSDNSAEAAFAAGFNS